MAPKEPLKCWECGEPHLRINCPCYNGASKMLHNLQEASTVGEIGKNYHKIHAALEDRQADHQSTIVDIEGIISNHALAILIDPSATLSYITLKMMELCILTKVRYAQTWLVQIAMGEKRKVTDYIADCEVELQGHKTRINLNILPLESYDIIIVMDWVERNRVILNCLSNNFTYITKD